MNGFVSVHEAPRRGRVEVLGGPARRRRYSTEEKAALVAASLEPGALVSDLARRRGMHPQVLFAWRRLAREGKLALPAEALPMFAAVVAADDAPPIAQAASCATPVAGVGGDEVVVELGALRLRIGPDVAPARVAALVAALQAAR
jgi:transposase